MEYIKAKTIVTRTKNNWWFGADYGMRYQANSPNSRRLYHVFKKECDRLGLLYNMEDITADYQKNGFWTDQLSLF